MKKGMKEIIDYGLNSCVDGQDSKNKITGMKQRYKFGVAAACGI
jgi:hypothetical protein